jgi:hypothetical protein
MENKFKNGIFTGDDRNCGNVGVDMKDDSPD